MITAEGYPGRSWKGRVEEIPDSVTPRHVGLPRAIAEQAGLSLPVVDVANELFATSATITRAKAMADTRHPQAIEVLELADLFCRSARRKIERLFHDLWSNDDVAKYKTALHVLEGRHLFVEKGITGLDAVAKAPAVSRPRDEARVAVGK